MGIRVLRDLGKFRSKGELGKEKEGKGGKGENLMNGSVGCQISGIEARIVEGRN